MKSKYLTENPENENNDKKTPCCMQQREGNYRISGYQPIKGSCCKKITANKLNTYDWLGDMSEPEKECEFIEVQFKNTRKVLKCSKSMALAVSAALRHGSRTWKQVRKSTGSMRTLL